MSDCTTCGQIENCSDSDLLKYSLDGDVFSFVINCQSGDCMNQTECEVICCGVSKIVEFSPGEPLDSRMAKLQDAAADCFDRCEQGGSPVTGRGGIGGQQRGGSRVKSPRMMIMSDEYIAGGKCPDGSIFYWTSPKGAVGRGISTQQWNAFSTAEKDAFRETVNKRARDRAIKYSIRYKTCLSSIPKTICCGHSAKINIDVTCNNPALIYLNPNDWSLVSGAVPDGMTLGVGQNIVGRRIYLEGTPTKTGEFTFEVRFVSGTIDKIAGQVTRNRTYTIKVIGITNENPMPPFEGGVPYSQTLTTYGFDQEGAFYVDDASPDQLPDGVTLDEVTGVISGTPTETPDHVLKIIFCTTGEVPID